MIERCTFCKQECEPQGITRRFFKPIEKEIIEVPDNMARCAIFRNDIKAILLREGEVVDEIHFKNYDGERKVSTEQI